MSRVPFDEPTEAELYAAKELSRLRQSTKQTCNAELAAFLSLVVPGTGHLYLGESKQGISFLLVALVGAILVLPWIACMLVSSVSAYRLARRRNGQSDAF